MKGLRLLLILVLANWIHPLQLYRRACKKRADLGVGEPDLHVIFNSQPELETYSRWGHGYVRVYQQEVDSKIITFTIKKFASEGSFFDDDSNLLSHDNMGTDYFFFEYKFMACQEFEGIRYVQKRVYSREELCPPVVSQPLESRDGVAVAPEFVVEAGEVKGSFDRLPSYFRKMNLVSGSYESEEIRCIGDPATAPFYVRRIHGDHMSIRRMVFTMRSRAAFHGIRNSCILSGGYFYLIEAPTVVALSDQRFQRQHRHLEKIDRLRFYIKIFKGLKEYQSFGVVHNDLDLRSLGVDRDGNVRVIRHPCTAFVSAMDDGCGDDLRKDRNRKRNMKLKREHDLFAAAMIIFSLESAEADKIWTTNWRTGQPLNIEGSSERKTILRQANMAFVLMERGAQGWGTLSDRVNDLTDMNFTTFFFRLMVLSPGVYSIETVIAQLERYLDDLLHPERFTSPLSSKLPK